MDSSVIAMVTIETSYIKDFCFDPSSEHSPLDKMQESSKGRSSASVFTFVEYQNEIAHNSRDASFLSNEDFTEVAFATIQSPENKNSLLTN